MPPRKLAGQSVFVKERVDRLLRGVALIEELSYCHHQPLPPWRYQAGKALGVAPDLEDGDWPTVLPGSVWGQPGQSFILRTTFQAPPANSRYPWALVLALGDARQFVHPEALAYVDGRPYQGINAFHQELVLAPALCDNAPHELTLAGWMGTSAVPIAMGRSDLVGIHLPTRHLAASMRVTLGVLQELDEDDPVWTRLLDALDGAYRRLDLREPLGEHFYASVADAQGALDRGLEAAGSSLDVDIVAVGHAHIDVAWLWPLNQTRHKVARTFSIVLRLMEQYPEFHFLQSQPQLYHFLAEDHPQLFLQVQARVAEGRWEVTGGTWVEPDCNLAGAEALVRQLLLGRAYFREHFGNGETPILWLPDTFGFPWTLPQLIRQAGLTYFMTTKLSWNQTNRLPYDSFWWRGLDGTEVLTHCITTPNVGSGPFNTYNGDLAPRRVMGTWRNYQHKEIHTELLTAFGWGDGGGGPTAEMLENGQRLANHPGMPRVRQASAHEFFRHLEARSGHKLPVWHGELYLELHRGTYTSQARTKRNNRKAEFLLHDAEFLAAWAALETGFRYPHEQLAEIWRLLCLNQFHDILPGTSVGLVYQESQRDIERIFAAGKQMRNTALSALVDLLPESTAYVVANPTSCGGRHIGLLAEHLPTGQTLFDLASGTALVTQAVDTGTLVEIPRLEPYGLLALGTIPSQVASLPGQLAALLEANQAVLENDLLRVEFDRSGQIVSLVDKRVGREVVPAGRRANVFQAFEDRPLGGDAWNIGPYYEDKGWPLETLQEVTVVETGPLRASLQVRHRLLQSEIIQRICLCRGSARLDFATRVQWRERHVLLKVAVPVDILSCEATYDIQWGNIGRPAHRNTSWDWARYEVCGHKWADLSEGDYGVSLLSDCKYGYDVRDNVLRLTLVRGPSYPDPDADLGEHDFTYSLLPHQGDWRHETLAAGYALNDPPIIQRVRERSALSASDSSGRAGRNRKASLCLVAADQEHVIVETVKQAEEDRGLVVRLYEAQRCRGPVVLRTSFSLAAAWRTNLLEEDQERLAVDQNAVRFQIKPYEIVTLRLLPALSKPGEL